LVCGILLFASAIAATGWLAFRDGFSARTQPTRLEAQTAQWLLHASVPSQYRALRNPVPPSPEALREGMEHYADHCANCHANDGSGNTMYGRGLNPPPPDLRRPETQSKSDGELYAVIQNGVRLTGMPAFGTPGTHDHGSWQLVLFLRHLPELSADELVSMQHMNPITPSEMKEQQQEDEFLSGAPAPTHKKGNSQ
jgi:mono/diheme cytochrome c family protein